MMPSRRAMEMESDLPFSSLPVRSLLFVVVLLEELFEGRFVDDSEYLSDHRV